MSTLLKLNNVCLTLDEQVCLQALNLHVTTKGISIVMGANGAGKTLLLKLCAGLLQQTSGQLEYTPPLKPTLQHPQITFVPQQPVLLNRTVADNIAIPLQCNGIAQTKQRVKDALNWAKITTLATKAAMDLSTGQQQLVALARAWALQPTLLLLDEPCANLDPQRTQLIEQLIHTLDQQGCKIVMSSHNITQAKRLADDIIFMSAGTIKQHQSCDLFFNETTSKDIQAFIQYS